MPTGAFYDQPIKGIPKGPFGPNSQLDFPFDWTAWLAGSLIADHNIVLDEPLVTIVSAVLGPLVVVVVNGGGAPFFEDTDTLLTVSCDVVTNDDPPRKERRSIQLKVVRR